VTLPLEDDAPVEGPQPIDGRRARRERSRQQVVDAVLDLLDEGVLRPTAQMVAERSGISLRSIFRIFDDVQSLHEAATARHLERVGHLFRPIASAEGDLGRRIEQAVGTLAELYEAVGPIRRAGQRLAPESEVFRARLDQARVWVRGELERVFAPELAATDDPTVAPALEAVCSFEAWDQLREGQGCSVAEARRVVSATVARLLG